MPPDQRREPPDEERTGSDGNGEAYPLPRSVRCPFCEKRDTELQSPFGGVMSVAQYYCRRCRTVFDWIKWGGPNCE